MGIFNKNTNGDTPVAWYWFIPGLIWYALRGILYVPAKYLSEKVYDSWDGAVRAVVGLLLAFYFGAFYFGHLAGWEYGLPWYKWLAASGAGFIAVFFYVWPALWLFPIQYIWKLCDWIHTNLRKWVKANWEKTVDGVLKGIRTITGSNSLWTKALADGPKNSWFAGALAIIVFLSVAVCTIYLAGKTYFMVEAATTAPIAVLGLGHLAVVLAAGIAAVFVLWLVGGTAWLLLENGELPFVALIYGGVAVWGQMVLGLHAHALGWTVLEGAVTYLLSVGYVFPLAVLAFSNNFWKKVWKNYLEPLGDKAYWEKDEKYAQFFHHIANVAATAGVVWGTLTLCGAVALPPVAAYALTALIGWCFYGLFFQALNTGGGNLIVGILLSLAAAFYTGHLWLSAGLVYGVWGAIGSGVITALASGIIFFPLLYWAARAVFTTLRVTLLGGALDWIYNKSNTAFLAAQKRVKALCKQAYDKEDATDKKNDAIARAKWMAEFLHVVNIGIAYAVWFGFSHLVASGSIAALIGTIVVTALSYLVIGKLLFKSGYGVPFVSTVTGLYAAFLGGTYVYSMAAASITLKVAALASALFVWLAVFFILFPIAYWVLGKVIGSWTASWLGAFLAGVWNFCWTRFNWVWNFVEAAYKVIAKVLAPVFARIGKAMASIKRAYDSLVKIFNRK